MGELVRSAPTDSPHQITGRERPRLPIDGFLDRLRPRDPRVAPLRPLGHRVMTNAPRILPLVHIPAELLAPVTLDRANPRDPELAARLPPLRPTSPPSVGRDEERVPTGAFATATPGPRPASPSGVTTNSGSPGEPQAPQGRPAWPSGVSTSPRSRGEPQAPEESRVGPQQWPLRTTAASTSSSSSVSSMSPASPASPAGRARDASAVGTASADGVPIVRGRPAEERASRHAARATSTADAIHLPDRHGPLGTPEADALLAHELVHVHARRRTPAADVATPAARASEERVARAVESEVRQGRRPAPSAVSQAPNPTSEFPVSAAKPHVPVDGRDNIVEQDPASPRPRDPGRSPTVGIPDDALAAQLRMESKLVAASDEAAVGTGAQQRSSPGPGPSLATEVSRASEPPAAADATSDDDRLLDRLAGLLAERLRDELFVGRERGGGVLDLSRW